jgi:hypothetical protein
MSLAFVPMLGAIISSAELGAVYAGAELAATSAPGRQGMWHLDAINYGAETCDLGGVVHSADPRVQTWE